MRRDCPRDTGYTPSSPSGHSQSTRTSTVFERGIAELCFTVDHRVLAMRYGNRVFVSYEMNKLLETNNNGGYGREWMDRMCGVVFHELYIEC